MDPEALAMELSRSPEAVEFLIEGMAAKKARLKYGCDKVLRALAAAKPQMVYPFFDRIAAFLECENSFLRWGTILTLSHLAAAAPRVAMALPGLRERIVKEILKVEKARFLFHGKPSPECGRVACGQALAALEVLYPHLGEAVARKASAFIRRQTSSPRPAVRKRALRIAKELGL